MGHAKARVWKTEPSNGIAYRPDERRHGGKVFELSGVGRTKEEAQKIGRSLNGEVSIRKSGSIWAGPESGGKEQNYYNVYRRKS